MAINELQAKRYAQAVFEIAQEKNELDRWQADLQKMALLARESELVAVIDNPRYSFEDKSRLISLQIKNVNPLALNLLYLLISQGKFSLLPGVAGEYQQLLDDFRGIEKVEVTTAVQMDDEEKANLAKRLSSMTGKRITIISKVDPKIVGGVVIRMGGKLIDGSLASSLAALKDEISSSGS